MANAIHIGDRIFDLCTPIDISIPIDFSDSVSAFGVSPPQKKAYQTEGFVGNVDQGGSCNCAEIVINPHCHGTHTECIGHILKQGYNLPALIQPFFGLAQLVSIETEQGVSARMLQDCCVNPEIAALIVRTLPNGVDKKNKTYQGRAAYMQPDAMGFCNALGIAHLLVDFPSVDPMDDGGELLAHRQFWQVKEGETKMPATAAAAKSITELIYVPSQVEDGIYGLNLQMSHIVLDAVPSRPLIYKEIV